MSWSNFFLYFYVLLLVQYSFGSVSFYELLGVSTDADTRTIRKAFKKLAIIKHPDKNKNDPNSHAEFVRINRAYEVLKDDELRKKYDEFGEEGLDGNANNQGNQQYQSWQFYRDNFGIYDDNVEIVTLSRADFQDEVFQSNDLWFINFYSTYCSHCHALAPAWREFAKEMDGIVKIGAVNCAEDPGLCQSQHVMAYPSLVVYPQHVFYQGPRDVQSLTDFILARITTPVYNLLSAEDAVAIGRDNGLPLLVEYCGVDEICLTFAERKKVASLLSSVANFGIVQCVSAKKLCESFLEHGFAFYPNPQNRFQREDQKKIEFVELKELYVSILRLIDDLNRIDSDTLKALLSDDVEKDENELRQEWDARDTAVLFFDSILDVAENDNINLLDYKKLAKFSPNLRIYMGDCSTLKTECFHRLHLKNLPKTVLFRASGGFDIQYDNKFNEREVEKFLRKSLASSLISVTDEQYHNIFEQHRADLLIVDYFAPWCPPCLRLIHELRSLPAMVAARKVQVATVDCDAYKSICSNLQIKSYPTTILYADDKTFNSIGFHGVDQIIEFIEESLNPSVQKLIYEMFQEAVINRPYGQLVMVDFYVSWCGPCQQLAPEFQKLARSFRNNSDVISFGKVDCDEQRDLCLKMGIRSYPSLRLFDGKQNPQPKHYPANWWRDFKSMQNWVTEQLPSFVERISGNFHTEILGSTMPILIDYYSPWCGHCVQFAPVLEQIAKLLDGVVRVGKVNCDMTPHICQMAAVQAYPSLRLYLGAAKRPEAYDIALQPLPNAEHVAATVVELLDRYGVPRALHRDEL